MPKSVDPFEMPKEEENQSTPRSEQEENERLAELLRNAADLLEEGKKMEAANMAMSIIRWL